ncbi:MAG: hypothetical protein ACE5E1_01730 [Phycisphaerae bacterium]
MARNQRGLVGLLCGLIACIALPSLLRMTTRPPRSAPAVSVAANVGQARPEPKPIDADLVSRRRYGFALFLVGPRGFAAGDALTALLQGGSARPDSLSQTTDALGTDWCDATLPPAGPAFVWDVRFPAESVLEGSLRNATRHAAIAERIVRSAEDLAENRILASSGVGRRSPESSVLSVLDSPALVLHRAMGPADVMQPSRPSGGQVP